jgi:Leucine-rich repeat (LRR) protein
MTRPDASYSNFVKSESMSRALLALVLLAAVASAQQKNAFKAAPTCPDYDVLMTFYNTTQGPNWTRRHNWGSTDCCDANTGWYGLNCDSANNVIMITLPENNLSGSFPEILTKLTRLRVLNLALNNLSGALPVSIAQWTELEALTLFSNNLTGALPPCFGNFSRLQTLELFSNKFSGAFPKGIGLLENLTTMWVNDNLISSVDAAMPQPRSIFACDLSANPLRCPVPGWAAGSCAAVCS